MECDARFGGHGAEAGDPEGAMKLLDRAMAAAPQELVIAVTMAELKLQQKDASGAEKS